MPNIKSAKKRVKVIKAKTYINTIRKSSLKTSLKKCKLAIENKDDSANTLLNETISLIDRASKNNIMHKNTAARKKSQLTKAFNSMASN